jgi:hypothetical protein
MYQCFIISFYVTYVPAYVCTCVRTYVHTVNAHVHLYVFNLRTIHVLHIPKVCYIVISIACLRFSQILRNMLYRGSEVGVYVRTCTCVFTCTLCTVYYHLLFSVIRIQVHLYILYISK